MSNTVVGRDINRVGGTERITGSYRYVGDIKISNMLHTKLVHLDCGRARIKSVDTTAAYAVPGVRAILTGKELPPDVKRFGPANRDRPILAADETKFHGEPVAIVAADTPRAALRAARAVVVDYEELPGVYSITDALAPGAPLVQDPSLRPASPHKNTNILKEWEFGWGDVAKAERSHAEVVIENDYTFPIVTQFAIEPLTYLAEPTRDGMTVYSAIQHPTFLQKVIAEFLDLPLARVRIVAPDPGGAFGGKQHAKFEPLLAYFALKIGRPLRLELTLEETFQTVRRAAAEAHVRTGFRRDGTMVFQDLEINYLIGAYEDIAGRVVAKASYAGAGPYRVPHVRIVARGVFSHTLPSTAYRGFGIPQVNWAVESQMNAAARELEIDAAEIRLRNLPEYGEVFMPQDPPVDGRWSQTVLKAMEAIGWNEPVPAGRGRGIAVGLKFGATTGASYSIVRFHTDGSATVYAGTSDMGQGARTVLAQMAAEELGLSSDDVVVVMGDTQGVPFDLQTSASRSTVFMGGAVTQACRHVAQQFEEIAREVYSPGSHVVAPGIVEIPGVGRRSFSEIAAERFSHVKGEVIGQGSRRSEYVEDHPLHGRPAFYEFACTAVELEVDRDTGMIVFDKLVTVGDVGKAINPQHVAMQDDGGAIQGLGHTVMEHYVLDERGRVLNLGALDYRIPTSKDVPRELVSRHVENGDGPGPYGAKGCAEGGILAVSPAVAAAVYNAVGAVIRDLPLTPQRIWEALQKRIETEREGDRLELRK